MTHWPTGHTHGPVDRFDKPQQPDFHPVDDLSRFVHGRIIATESETRETVERYGEPLGPMVYRYAAGVRRDMVAFRRIVALYVGAVAAINDGDRGEREAQEDQALGLQMAVAAVASRWSDHPDFREEWRLTPPL